MWDVLAGELEIEDVSVVNKAPQAIKHCWGQTREPIDLEMSTH